MIRSATTKDQSAMERILRLKILTNQPPFLIPESRWLGLQNPFQFIDVSNRVNGFIVGYGDNLLQNLLEDDQISYQSGVNELLRVQNKPFAYIEQLAVLRGAEGSAKTLLTYFIRETSARGFHTVFSSSLYKQKSETPFELLWEEMDFRFITTVKNNDGLTRSVYRLVLDNSVPD